MKVAIITYHRAYNYGSVLQAYALNKTVTELGAKVDTIDYVTDQQKNICKHFQKNNSIMNIVRNIFTLRYLYLLKIKYNHFDNFIRKYIPTTSKKYTKSEQLNALDNQYDFFICGSDQIWNPNTIGFGDSFFLSFVKEKSKCISYGSSIALPSLSQKNETLFERYLKNYRFLSVREKTSAQYLTKLLNRKVYQVLDPVFLRSVDEWKSLCSNIQKLPKKYIFCYFIGDVPYMRDFAKQMHKETGWELIVVYKNLRDVLYKNLKFYDAGPQEFLELLKNATYVITNSFHAVCFSLLFKKNFWVFINKANNNAPNSRIVDLLTIFDLQNRIYDGNITDKFMPVSYTHLFEEKLKNDINFSILYLKKALYGEKDDKILS